MPFTPGNPFKGRHYSGEVILLAVPRPIMREADRAEVAGALRSVDAVTLFDEDTPRELIAKLLPDVLVKGADWLVIPA